MTSLNRYPLIKVEEYSQKADCGKIFSEKQFKSSSTAHEITDGQVWEALLPFTGATL